MFSLSLALTILLLGFRHGIDLDHIAAISDIVSQTPSQKKAFLNGFGYIFGHAVVIIILGILAIILGIHLPSWLDKIMGPVVGITLILLGLWIIFNRTEHKLVSKWMLMIRGFIHIYNHLFGDKHNHPVKYPQNFGIRSSYILGTIHGIGAETPTQVLLFVSAAGSGGLIGSLLLLTFVLGLLASNSLVLALSIFGFINAKKYKVYSILGLIAGIVSLIVGTVFLLGKI